MLENFMPLFWHTDPRIFLPCMCLDFVHVHSSALTILFTHLSVFVQFIYSGEKIKLKLGEDSFLAIFLNVFLHFDGWVSYSIE